jgi:DHA1 family inner membrane transport protein
MKNEKIVLFVLALVQFTNIMDFMIMMPLNPILSKLFTLNPKQFGILVSSYTLMAGISGFASAFFADRFDRKQLLLLMYAGFTLGTFACALASSYELLLLARGFTGIFGGVLGATVLSIVGDAIPAERRGAAMGIVMSAFALASVFGVPFGLFIANKFTWSAPFMFLAILGVFTTFMIFFLIPSFDKHLKNVEKNINPMQVLLTIFGDAKLRTALSLTFIVVLSQFCIIPFFSDYMVANVGFSQAQLPLIYLTGGIASIFTSPLVGRMADKFGKLQIFIIFAILLIIPVAIITNLSTTTLFVALCISVFFFICNGGRLVPAMTMTTSAAPTQTRGSFMSINSSIQNLSSALAAYIGGLIIYKNEMGVIFNYNYVGYLAITLNILAIFVAIKLQKTK